MAKDTSYRDYILYDVLGHIDGITDRAMFGGWGIYKDGLIIGIIAEGELYLKADPESIKVLTEQGCYPFSYQGKDGKQMSMAYMSVPEETLENQDIMEARIDESFAISARAKKGYN